MAQPNKPAMARSAAPARPAMQGKSASPKIQAAFSAAQRVMHPDLAALIAAIIEEILGAIFPSKSTAASQAGAAKPAAKSTFVFGK